MKQLLPLAAAIILSHASTIVHAQIYIPPDPTGDIQKESYGIWPNQGQIADLNGNQLPDVSFYTTGATPRAYFLKSGKFSLVLTTTDTTNMLDTLRELDVACTGPGANHPDPVIWQMKSQYANFYLPQCGPGGTTNVYPFARVIYQNIYNNIDMQVYSGEAGQKIAFVVNNGGNPATSN